MITLEALEHINIDHFDWLVRDRCLDVDKPDSLTANVAYFSRDIRQKLEDRARLFSWEVEPHKKFEVLLGIAINEALNEVVRDTNRLDNEILYLRGFVSEGENQKPSMFLGDVEVTTRKNPKIDVIDVTGTIINEGARVRLSSVMMLFGSIATVARLSLRTTGEAEIWDPNLDMAVGVQYALDLARSNVVIRHPLDDVLLPGDFDI